MDYTILPSLSTACILVSSQCLHHQEQEGRREAGRSGREQRRRVEGGAGRKSEEVVEKQEGETKSENK